MGTSPCSPPRAVDACHTRGALLTAGGRRQHRSVGTGQSIVSQKLRLVHAESEDPHDLVTSLVLKERLRIIVPRSPGVEQKGSFNLILTVPDFCHLRTWRRCRQNTVGCECRLKIKHFGEGTGGARETALSPNPDSTDETPETQEQSEALRPARVVGGRAGAKLCFPASGKGGGVPQRAAPARGSNHTPCVSIQSAMLSRPQRTGFRNFTVLLDCLSGLEQMRR